LAGDDNGQAGVNGVNGTATAGEGTSKRKRGMKSSTTKNTQTANTQTAGQQDNGQAGAVSKRRRLVKPSTKVRENIEDANVVKAAKVKKMAKDHAKKNQKEKSVAAAAELAAMDPDSDPIDLSSS
jgi:hypothetical protein